MRKSMIVLLVVVSASFFGYRTAYCQDKTAVDKIETYVENVDRAIKSKQPALVFADVSQNNTPRRRRFSSSQDLEKFRKKTETYAISNNWRRNGKIVISVFTLFSESGDWANYVYYYFRQDGRLAKI